MKCTVKSILLIACCCLYLACSKTHELATPSPDKEGPPIITTPLKSSHDVRNLHIVPYLDNLTSGRTQYISQLQIDDWLALQVAKPDLAKIVPRGEVVNLITVGGGLTAGAQSGGLFREGQLAAYPNLVAKQLGIANFETPLFDEAHSNGTGFTVIDDKTSQTFLKVENKSGTILEEEKGKPLKMSPYSGHVNNYSAPWLSTIEILDSKWEEKMIGQSVNGNGVSWHPFLPYVTRFIPIAYFGNKTLFNYIIENQNYNFFILEDVAELFFNIIRLKGSRAIAFTEFIGNIEAGQFYTLKAIKLFKENGANGVVFTVPHYSYFGISTWNIKALNEEERAKFDAGVDVTNKFMREWAKTNNLALVDLDSLYRNVSEGKVVIGKGIQVSGKFDGNFFSSDGIYPSTLGQAFVANEVIKAINLQFKSKIQPVDIETYLTSIKFPY